MKAAQQDHQNISTRIRGTLDIFSHALEVSYPGATAEIKVHLTTQQLALYSSYIASQKRPVVVFLEGSVSTCQTFAENTRAWNTFLKAGQTWHVLTGTLTTQELTGDASSSLSETIHHFFGLAEDGSHHFIIPTSLADSAWPNRTAYQNDSLELHTGERKHLQDVVRDVIERGYIRFEETLEAGGMRVRGEQIDIRHASWPGYYTITLYGNVIESIVFYHGRRSNTVTRLLIPPTRFPTPSVQLTSLLDNYIVFCPSFLNEARGQQTIVFDAVHPLEPFPLQPVTAVPAHVGKMAVVAFYQNYDRTAAYVRAHGAVHSELIPAELGSFPLALQTNTTLLVSEATLVPQATHEQPPSRDRGLAMISDLVIGKPAVHSDHGIGIFEGLQRRAINQQTREYLIIRYAGGDVLSVPVEYAHKVTAYLGEDQPVLHRLHGTVWLKTKRKAQVDARAFAEELMDIASHRAAKSRPAYAIDSAHEHELEQTFPYELTLDQVQAWDDVKSDLMAPQPMDRLIVGDVGFGKTELAIRAAYHVAHTGKQVAVLAPTTLLVQQHLDTFKTRLPVLASSIATLSRFTSPSDQKTVRARLATGDVRIVIGTHALLQSSVTWKNLGLCIIDEEQRFGVRQKEAFKKLRANVDIVSLTATPIPRTLSMALSGLRQLSIISTPPPGRVSIKTIVQRDRDALWEQALTFELNRGGQIYVVAPHIRHLHEVTHHVRKIVPQARVATAHGRTPNNELAQTIRQFDTGEIDVLVSSAIIENGLDVANANTIIVTRATHFGLADLYQLRGRVGRRQRQGQAYFLYNQHDLTPVQRKRLSALTETTRLGSGWQLAQRDLEIRGAGNILGAEQSGTVQAVGVQLYLDLVTEASIRLSEGSVRRHDVDISLPLPAFVPSHYVAAASERTTAYQRLARAPHLAALELEIDRLRRTWGELPQEVQNLVLLIKLQHVAATVGITSITSSIVTPSDEDPYQRICVRGLNLPRLAAQLGSIGALSVQNNALMISRDSIDTKFITTLTETLATPFTKNIPETTKHLI